MKELESYTLKILENDCPVRGLSDYLRTLSISVYNEDQVQTSSTFLRFMRRR